jgi:transposase
MLMIGYFEGIDSERGIAWRCADSLALRRFLGYPLDQSTPDHSSLSRIRGRLPLETHQAVFTLALVALAERGLLSGKTVGVDATTLEANAAMRSIVRRDTDKGYHSNDTCRDMAEVKLRSYVAEPDRGRRKWKDKAEEQQAVYANRRRIKGKRGKALMRKRGELIERSFAHCYETGGMRRTHLRGHPNILKRLLIHVAGFNFGLLLRGVPGVGTPQGLQGAAGARAAAFCRYILTLWKHFAEVASRGSPPVALVTKRLHLPPTRQAA